MLDKHLIATIYPKALAENIVYWENYRVTVLQDRLFRLEYNKSKQYRDDATQSVWFRNMPKQDFQVEEVKNGIKIITPACTLLLRKERNDCRIILNGKSLKIDNTGNLMGTYRTLDGYDGDNYVASMICPEKDKPKNNKIPLGMGVCSKRGVATFDDANSLSLGLDGEIKPIRGKGLDEYIFAYGNDYRSAVKALYLITGKVPLIPRFALGNWWSRYHEYTDKEYLRLLNSFEEENIPLTVATIDMDWHYSWKIEEELHITEKGKNTPFYGGNNGWTGYTWNKRLFPDYKSFLKEIQNKNLKITLNLHPADGVRWWESRYKDMAIALGKDASSEEWIKFDIANTDFINAYFSVLHKPYEKDGVAFWWVDWQQGKNSNIEGLDPLWSLNHYHYLDNGKDNDSPLILSRYCEIGSHRYPLGFSGDTFITWNTLDFLPYFTATASNVGYTWWSHDIGGHMGGNKDDEMYLRHLQYGVFSPINRLHSSNMEIFTKEPWAYGNGSGEIAKRYLRLRHKLIPYLYTASYNTHEKGIALVEPLYYQWKNNQAYKYKKEYLFGEQLLVIPVTKKANKKGFAYIKGWVPQGEWTDIFSGAKYYADEKGKVVTFMREMENIPVLIRSGGILPLSLDSGNTILNPEKMEINLYSGNGEYTLYEDGASIGKEGKLFTTFVSRYQEDNGQAKQTLHLSTSGDWSIIPENRKFIVKFKDIQSDKISLWVNGKILPAKEYLTDCAAIELSIEKDCEYKIEVLFNKKNRLEELLNYTRKVLTQAKGNNGNKNSFWQLISKANSLTEFIDTIDKTDLISDTVKDCLKEVL